MLLRAVARPAFFLSLCSTAAGQTVWTVTTPNGVQAAIDGAAPGDVIDLVGSAFAGFLVDKGVSIRGHGAYVGSGSPNPIVVNVPAGQMAHLDQIRTAALDVQGGSVRIDRSVFVRVSAANAQTVMVECTVVTYPPFASLPSPNAGISANAGTLCLRDCQVRGSNAGTYSVGPIFVFLGPTNALTIGNATVVHAERCQLTGGNGGAALSGIPSAGPAAAVSLPVASSAILADCTVTGGNGFAAHPGAPPVAGGGVLAMRGTTLITGAPASSTSVGNNAPLVAMELTPVWTRGTTSTLRVTGMPNEPHAVFATPASSAQTIPFVVEPVFVGGEFLIRAGLNDGAGLATHTVPVPNVPALQHVPVWCQAVGGVTLPLRASVIAGGLVR